MSLEQFILSFFLFIFYFAYTDINFKEVSLYCVQILGVSKKMSNSVSQSLLQRSLLRPVVVEHQSKLNSSSIPANTLFQSASTNKSTARARKSQLSTKFLGNKLPVSRSRSAMTRAHGDAFIARAVMTSDTTSSEVNKFLNAVVIFNVNISRTV